MAWTDERIEDLKLLWAAGLSASQIASRLGGVTRNAVIGKVMRLGLPRRVTTSRINGRKPRKKFGAPRPERPDKPKPTLLAILKAADGLPIPSPKETDIPRVAAIDLKEHHCRWSCVDDPKIAGAYGLQFCGEPRVGIKQIGRPVLPYCEVHAPRAYQPPKPRPRAPKAPVLATEAANPQRPAANLEPLAA